MQGVILSKPNHFALLRTIYSESGKHEQLLKLLEENALKSDGSSQINDWENDQWRLKTYDEVTANRDACFALAAKVIKNALENNIKWKLDDWSPYHFLIHNAHGDQ